MAELAIGWGHPIVKRLSGQTVLHFFEHGRTLCGKYTRVAAGRLIADEDLRQQRLGRHPSALLGCCRCEKRLKSRTAEHHRG